MSNVEGNETLLADIYILYTTLEDALPLKLWNSVLDSIKSWLEMKGEIGNQIKFIEFNFSVGCELLLLVRS